MSDLLPYSIYYQNSDGGFMRFDELPVLALSGTIFDGLWKLTRARRPLGEGGSLLTRSRSDAERTLVLHLSACDAQELSDIMCRMRDLFDRDIESRTSGRLWINDCYMRCWCSARTKELSCDITRSGRITLTILPEHPAWCTDRSYELAADPSLTDSSIRILPVENTSCSPAPMILTIHGPAQDPTVYIGGTATGIDRPLAEGERVVIDQQSRRVTGYTADGQALNYFSHRIKNGSAFEYAPAGAFQISVKGPHPRLEVTLIEQRSEPAWSRS